MGETLAIATGAAALGGSLLLLLGGSSPFFIAAPIMAWGVVAWSGALGSEGLT